jgi:predicted transcriptional regulator
MKNRSRLDIAAEILTIANDGAMKTKIMYSAYISFYQLKEYVSILVKNGLLDYDSRKKLYRTTERGHEFLVKYQKLRI